MFKFLKDKLKGAIAGISKKVEEEGKDEHIEIEKKPSAQEIIEDVEKKAEEIIIIPETEKKGFFSKIKQKIFKKEEQKEEPEPEQLEIKEEEEKEKKEQKEIVKEIKEAFENEEPKEIIKEKKEELRQEIKEAKEELEKKKEDAEKKIKDKIKKKETPKISELVARKPELLKRPASAPIEEKEGQEQPEKKGFFAKIKEKVTTKKINDLQFNELFWDLEIILLENNVALEVIEKIKEDLKKNIVDKPILRSRISETISDSLKHSISGLFDVENINLIEKIKAKKPFVICFFGINGSGKTTTIAKLAYLLKQKGISSVMAASDTFRAAAIDQLQKHADKLGIKLIKHDYGSDAAAVAYDAIQHAKAKNIDVVLIDTAGRMHSNINLMDEMKKIIRVASPDMKVFVGESITGNDCIEQAEKFNEAVGIDAIILAKADIDEKGGAAISVSYVTKKPIIFLGTGQDYPDLKSFDSSLIIQSLEL